MKRKLENSSPTSNEIRKKIKMDFSTIENLVKDGKEIDITQADFDINFRASNTEYKDHDSSNYENQYEIITKYTLLHIAILHKNREAITHLLENKADWGINYTQTTMRRQRDISTNRNFQITVESEWTEWWVKEAKTLTCRELTSDQSILSILDQYSTSPSTPSNAGPPSETSSTTTVTPSSSGLFGTTNNTPAHSSSSSSASSSSSSTSSSSFGMTNSMP